MGSGVRLRKASIAEKDFFNKLMHGRELTIASEAGGRLNPSLHASLSYRRQTVGAG